MLSRLTSLLALLLSGCAPIINMANSAYNFCSSNAESSHQYFGSPNADDLVIFIHGLCGNAKTTWLNTSTNFLFPEELALDFARENQATYIVSFDYVSHLQGGPSILSIADHLEFEIDELLKKHPYRTLRIVAHSMGGLVAREYILRRHPRAHPQLKVTNVVLLASPSNGSELAALGQLVSKSRQIEELRHLDKGNTYLESLNKDWNREFKGGGHPRHVLAYAGYEELPMSVVGQVVRLSSAITYADETMGFQENHVSIAKPKERNVLYRWVKAKLGESLEKTARQLLDGMVQQGLLTAADIPQRLPRTVELLEGLQALAGTELETVLNYVKAGQFKKALALLDEREVHESQLIENIAQRRCTQGEIYELQFQMTQAAAYYSQAVQLTPTNGWFRYRYGWSLILTEDTRGAIIQFEEAERLALSNHNSDLEGGALAGLGVANDYLGHYAKAIEYHHRALAIHRKLSDVRSEGADLGNLGNAYLHLGEYTKVIEYHGQALMIYRKLDDKLGESAALGNLGNVFDTLEQRTKAIEHHEQALLIHRTIGNLRGEAITLGNLGLVYSKSDEYSKAIQHYNQALALHRKIGNVRGEGAVLGNLGSAYRDLGEYTKAIEYHEQALAIHRKIADVRGESADLGNLGNVYESLEQYLKAIELYNQALVIHRKIADVPGEGVALGNLGNAYLHVGQHTEAIKHSNEALAIRVKIGDLRGEGADLGNLGNAYDSLGQHAKAIEFHEKALVIHRKLADLRREATTLANLGLVYGKSANYLKAIEYYDQALLIHHKLGDLRSEGTDLAKLGTSYRHLEQYAKAIERYEQALVIWRKLGDVRGEAVALGNLGLVYGKSGQGAKAIEFLGLSELIFKDQLKVAFPLKSELDQLKNRPKN